MRGERGHAQQTNTRTFEEENDFSSLLRDLGIPYPKFGAVNNAEEAVKLSRELGFPLLVWLGVATLGLADHGSARHFAFRQGGTRAA